MNRIVIATAAIVMSATGAFAYGERTIDANQAALESRIETNRLSGQLTRREYRNLKAEQAHIRELESRARADGHVSRREYRRIHAAQAEAYRDIKSESSDRQVNFLRRWLWRHR